MVRLAIFASGSGTNAENIAKYFAGNKNISVDIIISNRPDAYVHERAKSLNIKSVTFTKNEFEDSVKIIELLKKRKIDFIILSGFLLKVPKNIIDLYPDRIINIHPALLPKYGGKGMYGDNVHRAVLEAKEKESGITIHYVNENYDEGNIIFQVTCNLDENDTYELIANKVHELEYKYFPQVIEKVINRAIL